jgi:hypothetical protein
MRSRSLEGGRHPPDHADGFVALASAALFIGAGNSISGIWTAVNTQLAAANTSAS